MDINVYFLFDMFVIWSEKEKDGLVRFSGSDILRLNLYYMIYEQACGIDWNYESDGAW